MGIVNLFYWVYSELMFSSLNLSSSHTVDNTSCQIVNRSGYKLIVSDRKRVLIK